MAVLYLRELVKHYGGRKVVDAVSLELESGQVAGLLGPNGAGKTTTFYMTVGMIRPDSGTIALDGDDITQDPMHIRARKGLGYLPQESSVFRKLTVEQNIRAILEYLNVPEEQQIERTRALLKELGIDHLAKQRAAVLSGGERRRLEISRVLATNPSFVLLDEPFAGIDPLAVADIQSIIRHLTDRGLGVLVSDHNVRETLGVCDKAYILNNGKVIEAGTPQMIAESKTARSIYLGEAFRL
ncbi:MAG: LPS export ABC transporter ATP-binding protein [Thermodesulfobacteriota bacterium]